MVAAVEMQRSSEEVVQPRRPRLTRRILLVLGLMNLVDCVNVNILTPYVEDLMSMLLHKPRGPGLAFPVAALIGVYSICEFLFSYMWGALADRTGRRPVLLVGITGSAVAPIFMGTARSLFQAFFARGLDGFFCGNVGVSKAYLGELVEPGNEASSFGFLALTFSCGLILGPIFGGQLVRPAEWAPGIFKGTIFDDYPFLLANASYALLAVLALVVGVTSLEETLPAEKRKSVCPAFCCRRRREAREALLAASSEQQAAASSSTTNQNPLAPPLLDGEAKDAEAAQPEPQRQPSQTDAAEGAQVPPPRLCSMGPLLWSNIIYCCLSSYFTEWAQLFAVLTSAKLSQKGFDFTPSEIGNLQLCAAAGLLFTQLLAYPRFCKRFGYFRAFQVGAVANLSVSLLFPLYTHWADPEEYGMWRYVPLAIFQAIGQAGAGFMFPTTFVWINRSAPAAIKGQANGLVNTTGALSRALWPQLCGTLLQALSGDELSVWWRFAMFPINGILLFACLIVLPQFPRSFSGLPSDTATQQPEESDAGKSPTSSAPSEDSEAGVGGERGA